MKRIINLTVAALLLVACAHGKTEHFPTVENPSNAAEVFVIRDNNFIGWGFSLKVALDDAIIARLRSGEYVSFYVTPGFHSLGITESSLSVPFAKDKKYYFLISPDYSSFGFEMQRLGEKKGQEWLTRTKPIT